MKPCPTDTRFLSWSDLELKEFTFFPYVVMNNLTILLLDFYSISTVYSRIKELKGIPNVKEAYLKIGKKFCVKFMVEGSLSKDLGGDYRIYMVVSVCVEYTEQ